MNKLKAFIFKNAYPISFVLLSILFFLALELRYPYFFLQDENRMASLPHFVNNYKNLLNGSLTLYNFHQFLGFPSMATGSSITFYPLNYLSTFFSKIIFGHYFAAVDITVIFQLVFAGLGFFYFLRRLKLDNSSSFFGAVTWAFCTYNIYVSDSWWQISGFAAYFPWSLFLCLKIFEKFSYFNFSFLILLRILAICMTYPQYFIYCTIFEILTLSLIILFKYVFTKAEDDESNENLLASFKNEIKTHGKKYSLSYLFSVILAAPAISPLIYEYLTSINNQVIRDYENYSYKSSNLLDWFINLVNPATSQYSWGALLNMSYVGYIAVILFVLSIVVVFLLKKDVYKNLKFILVTFLCLMAFSLLWSSNIVIASIFYAIPILKGLNDPFKLNFFTMFYFVSVSSLGFFILKDLLSNFFRSITIQRAAIALIVLLQIASILGSYIVLPQKKFAYLNDRIPFDEPLKNELKDDRIASFNYSLIEKNPVDFAGVYNYPANSIYFDYATLFDLYHFSGYEFLLPNENIDTTLGLFSYNYMSSFGFSKGLKSTHLDLFRDWGVKWYIVKKGAIVPDELGLVKKFSDESRDVYFDGKANPLFYFEDLKSSDGIRHKINANSIELEVENNDKNSRKLVVNFIYNSFFKAYNGQAELPISKLESNQMVIDVPNGKQNIVIKYENPIFKTACITSGVMLVLLLMLLSIKKFGIKV